MPLVAWAVLAYAAGLIAGLSLTSASTIVASTVVSATVIACLLAGHRVLGSLAAVLAAGLLVAMGVAAADSRCKRVLEGEQVWRVLLEADAVGGAVAHGQLQGHGCSARVTMLVTSGMGRGGTVVTVRGTATSDARGMFMQGAELGAPVDRSLLLSLRAATGQRIDRVFGSDAPMARALVIADMSSIPVDERDRYARAGLVHMLSVSGLHVGIVALALELLASVLRLPRAPSSAATMLLLAVYIAAIGAPPPAVRAGVMLAAVLLCRLLQRPTSRWAILAVGAGAPLVDPRTAIDLGWQLSVAGTAALVSGGALAARIVPSCWSGWRRSLASGATISVVATLATAPLVAWTFGRVSLVGPVTNLLADPVMGLVQPLLFLALAIPVHSVEVVCAGATHLLLRAFGGIASGAASLPWAAPAVLPTATTVLAGAVAAIALLTACAAERPLRALLTLGGSLSVMLFGPLVPHATDQTEIHMIDVGQGDALAIRTRAGRWIVIDAGRSWPGGDAGASTVVPYLSRRGGAVALFVLSHPHADHVGGARALFDALHPARFLDPGYVGTSPPYRAALGAARRDGIAWQRVHPGDSLVVDEVVLTALAPDSTWAASLSDANLASAVVMARVGGVRVLFTGDAESPEEEWLLAHTASLRADVLKVGHHGSRTSTSPHFLEAVQPRLALLSVGAHNSYGHPDAEVLERLDAAHVAILRTDRLGSVVLRTDGREIRVETKSGSWRLPARARDERP